MAEQLLETKTAFAQRLNVTQGRISQYIKNGMISAAALDGEGRRAKIIVAIATKELDSKLDAGQRLGNGLNTKIEVESIAHAESASAIPRYKSSVEKLADEKLIQSQMATRRMVEEEKSRQGKYTLTSEVRSGYIMLAGSMIRIFEGSLPDFATAISARFELSQRDVLHLLKAEFRKVSEAATKSASQKMGDTDNTKVDLDRFLEVDIDKEGEA